MGKKLVKILFVSSFLIITLMSIYLYHFEQFVELKIFKKNYVLLIGILSSPENFERRLSIRKTWLQLLPEISGISYFIVGKHLCHIPKIDRADPYACIDGPFSVRENDTSETEFITMKLSSQPMKKTSSHYIGFGFYTRSQILVTKLGILSHLLKGLNHEIQVKIIAAQDGRVLASATFDRAMVEKETPLITAKTILPVLLPSNFEAFVKLEGKDLKNTVLPKCSSSAWMTEPNVITFINLWELNSKIPHPFTNNSCTSILMTYTIPDIKDIKTIMQGRSERLKNMEKSNFKLREKLQNENLIYKDILFVDVVDVYRNLCLKMLKFYKRIAGAEYFHFVLKTDDDSFIDLLRVEELLKNILNQRNQFDSFIESSKNPGTVSSHGSSKFWWWSFFREFWKVQLSGKWRENQYKSASYPSFPCGGGYVLSESIVKYIALNEGNFNCFQGEDVSIGIWLSPLPVTYFTEPKLFFNKLNALQNKIITKFKGKYFWREMDNSSSKFQEVSDICDWSCTNEKRSELPLCNRVQNTIETMYLTWNDYISSGFC